MGLLLTLHVLAVIIWVGGMFFSHMAFRPVAVKHLDPPLRLVLIEAVLSRFFKWVWVAVVVILITGGWLMSIYSGGQAPLRLTVMTLLGSLMAALFVYLYFRPYQQLTHALKSNQMADAASSLNLVRHIITVNLTLGIVTVVIAVAGRFVI